MLFYPLAWRAGVLTRLPELGARRRDGAATE